MFGETFLTEDFSLNFFYDFDQGDANGLYGILLEIVDADTLQGVHFRRFYVAGQLPQHGDFLQYTLNVAEPSSFAILGLGLLGVAAGRRRIARL